MEENKQHCQHIMLYYFKKGKNAAIRQKKICEVYGEGAVTDQMCQKWLRSFMLEISLDTAPWLGRPAEVDDDQIKTLVENNESYTTW